MTDDLSMVFFWYCLSSLRGEIYPNITENGALRISVSDDGTIKVYEKYIK